MSLWTVCEAFFYTQPYCPELNFSAFTPHKCVLQSHDFQTWVSISLRSAEPDSLRDKPKDLCFYQTPVVIPRGSKARNLSFWNLSSSAWEEKQSVSPQTRVKLEGHKRFSTATDGGFVLGLKAIWLPLGWYIYPLFIHSTHILSALLCAGHWSTSVQKTLSWWNLESSKEDQ